LGLANGICLVALALLIGALPFSPRVSYPLGAAFLACGGTALWLRHRFWSALDRELGLRRRAELEARAADIAKGRFLASVSHEIRTPMCGILGVTDLLLGSGLTPAQRDQVELVRTSAEALLAQVDDILDLSRIEAGRLLLRPRDFRLEDLTGNVLRLLAPQAGERGLDLRLETAPGVPDDLHGDPVRLRQVLLNLVGNAIRFTRQGSVTVRVEAELSETQGSTLFFAVRDTGAGIRPEVQARLFQPFAQSDSSASRHLGGTGLGLVISKSLVELMNGEIGFESTYGSGSTFWFRVPLVRALGSGSPPWTPAGEGGQPVPRPGRRGLRILVVDDRAPNRAAALSLLGHLGHVAEAVDSGEEALARLARQSFDAVLLDSEMPGLDGRETCRRLRQREAGGPRTPVIAVTAHTRPEAQEACLAAGMDDCLVKPFTAADLAARLDRWVRPAAGDTLDGRLAALKALPAGAGPDMQTQIVEAFLQQGEADLATLRRALQQEDLDTLAETAHALAGCAALLGARDLAESAGDLSHLAWDGDLAACAARLPQVERDCHDTLGRISP
jgi:signal transduction histidine kinase/DNA-binding response OmpR family regulator